MKKITNQILVKSQADQDLIEQLTHENKHARKALSQISKGLDTELGCTMNRQKMVTIARNALKLIK